MSYYEKLQRIKAKLEAGSQAALRDSPSDESSQYRVLIEGLEEIAKLLSSDHSWLDLSSKEYAPRSSSAPPVDRAVERMAWAVNVVGLQVNALQDIFTQNQMMQDVIDSIAVTPIVVKAPNKLQEKNPDERKGSLLDALPVGTTLERSRGRKFSGSGKSEPRLFSPPGRPSPPQPRTPQVGDALAQDQKSSSSPSILKAATGLTKKISDLSLGSRQDDRSDGELRQFHVTPLPNGGRERSASSSNLNAFLGKGKMDSTYDANNRI